LGHLAQPVDPVAVLLRGAGAARHRVGVPHRRQHVVAVDGAARGRGHPVDVLRLLGGPARLVRLHREHVVVAVVAVLRRGVGLGGRSRRGKGKVSVSPLRVTAFSPSGTSLGLAESVVQFSGSPYRSGMAVYFYGISFAESQSFTMPSIWALARVLPSVLKAME